MKQKFFQLLTYQRLQYNLIYITNISRLFKIKGFSLIELLTAIAIIAILTSIAIFTYQNNLNRITYNNSMNTLNQNRLVIYKLFLQNNQTCPNNNSIQINLNPINSYYGNNINNNGCDLQLRANDRLLITLRANIANNIDNAFNDGITFNCIINTIVPNEINNINNYLRECITPAP